MSEERIVAARRSFHEWWADQQEDPDGVRGDNEAMQAAFVAGYHFGGQKPYYTLGAAQVQVIGKMLFGRELKELEELKKRVKQMEDRDD